MSNRLLLICATLVAFAVRTHGLGKRSLWYDETVSVFLANQPLAKLLAHTARDIHPPGYYLLLWLWRQMTEPLLTHGVEYIFAYPSVIFGMLTLVILFPVGRRVGLSPAAIGIVAMLVALHPFQVWYSQEVRMYTLASFLGLLSIWIALRWLSYESPIESPIDIPKKQGIGYAVVGAVSLYILYYSGLTLVGVLLFVLWSLTTRHSWKTAAPRIVRWAMIHLLMTVLWLPWLPIFYRQAATPPVPVWRESWQGPGTVFAAIRETLAAILVGQTLHDFQWPVILLLGAAVAGGTMAYHAQHTIPSPDSMAIAACCLVLPIAILFGISTLGTPVYHVRYLFVYSSVALLVLATLLDSAFRANFWLASGIFVSIVALHAVGLYDYWTNPELQPDDHRGAVTMLSQAWRPGDVILLNAGWLYPVVTTYWPQEGDLNVAIPPAISHRLRLDEFTDNNNAIRALTAEPTLMMAGSVNGDSTLGWGLAESDFFVTTPEQTTQALDNLNQNARRIWHYRQYDTVSDPSGTIRAWLTTQTKQLLSLPIAGRDFGRIELYTTQFSDSYSEWSDAIPVANFADILNLVAVQTSEKSHPGELHYFELWWQLLPPVESVNADLAMSVRLYDREGNVISQRDEAPYVPTSAWPLDRPIRQVVALPIPHLIDSESYTAGLIVYRRDSLVPLTVSGPSLSDSTTVLNITNLEMVDHER